MLSRHCFIKDIATLLLQERPLQPFSHGPLPVSFSWKCQQQPQEVLQVKVTSSQEVQQVVSILNKNWLSTPPEVVQLNQPWYMWKAFTYVPNYGAHYWLRLIQYACNVQGLIKCLFSSTMV